MVAGDLSSDFPNQLFQANYANNIYIYTQKRGSCSVTVLNACTLRVCTSLAHWADLMCVLPAQRLGAMRETAVSDEGNGLEL